MLIKRQNKNNNVNVLYIMYKQTTITVTVSLTICFWRLYAYSTVQNVVGHIQLTTSFCRQLVLFSCGYWYRYVYNKTC